MGFTGSLIASILTIVCILTGGFLLDQQKHFIMEPFEDYLKFNQFVRDTNDLNYFLQSYQVYTEKDKFEKIDKQLEGSNTTRANIIEYYIEKIKNSVNHQDSEEALKSDRFRSVFNELDQDKIYDLFNQVNYNFTQAEQDSPLKAADKLFTFVHQTAINLNKADDKSFDIFVDEIQGQSFQQWIVVALIFSILFLLVLQCTFIPITYDVYKSRNKKSRRKEARMSKNTLYIHLGLHSITTLVMIIFIIIFYSTSNDFYDKTSRFSFDLLKYTKNYYFSLRLLQADDLINIQNVNEQSSIPVETVYKVNFLEAYKAIQNSSKFKIKFPELKELTHSYMFNSECNLQVIVENQQSTQLCQKYLDQQKVEKLKLTYQPYKKASSIEAIQYKDLYEENMIFDHFQIEFCHDICRQIKEVMEDYISTIQETVLLFLFQFGVCIGFLFIFWVPFFKDRSSYKKEAKRFEMVNEL